MKYNIKDKSTGSKLFVQKRKSLPLRIVKRRLAELTPFIQVCKLT